VTTAEFLAILKQCPLVASVQASPGSPLDDPETLLKLAKASLSQGVRVLRLEGVENIKRIQGETGAPVIGLIKRKHPSTEHYITATMREVEELLATECQVIALDSRLLTFTGPDAIQRCRAREAEYAELVSVCHSGGRLVLADCSNSSYDLDLVADAGCDLASTTFANPKSGHETARAPHLSDLGYCVRSGRVPVLAEGHYLTESHVRWAMQMGAVGVVVGGALNDPVKTTTRFVQAATLPTTNVGGVDIGGTWLRFGLFSPDWRLLERRRVRLPDLHSDRLRWIEKQARDTRVELVGVSTGGEVDPKYGAIWSSKETIPDNEGGCFEIDGLRIRALNDGLATTWAHAVDWSRRLGAMQFPSDPTATLAIGTGLGCGITCHLGLLHTDSYPRLNDLEFEPGLTFEQALGGMYLGKTPTPEQQATALRALERAIDILARLVQPRTVTICGGVGLSPWMKRGVKEMTKRRFFAADWGGQPKSGWAHEPCEVRFSPFGADAGLYGAAALALFPPIGVFPE
jgi:putative N-acetylmannosamine-6-phosphate epimerase/predicted NBD/HSP70 family sugar kinase